MNGFKKSDNLYRDIHFVPLSGRFYVTDDKTYQSFTTLEYVVAHRDRLEKACTT